MRAVLQRVSEAAVHVDGAAVGRIGRGLLVLVSVGQDDDAADVKALADKIAGLRCFRDADSKFNLSIVDIEGSFLVVSQFTLHGDCRKGRRPSFSRAAGPDKAVPLYEAFLDALRATGRPVETGQFGADMAVRLVNDGPVTLLIDTKKEF